MLPCFPSNSKDALQRIRLTRCCTRTGTCCSIQRLKAPGDLPVSARAMLRNMPIRGKRVLLWRAMRQVQQNRSHTGGHACA